MDSTTVNRTDYTCVVIITGVDEESAERIIRKDLDLSETIYTDLYVERNDDEEGIIARFDYKKSEQYSVMKLYKLLMASFAYSTEINMSLQIVRMDNNRK